MPVSEKKLPDKRSFDVYAMMTLLTAAALGGGIYFLADELDRNWYGQYPAHDNTRHPIHLTKINEAPEVAKNKDKINLRAIDLEEYEKAQKNLHGEAMSLTGEFQWPDGYDPLEHAIDPKINNWEKAQTEGNQLRIENFNALLKSYKGDRELDEGEAGTTEDAGAGEGGEDAGAGGGDAGAGEGGEGAGAGDGGGAEMP